MVILGINGGVRLGYQDVSATLLIDGNVVAAVEEERLNRIKFSPGQLSERSIDEVLRIANLAITDVDIIATHGATWGDTFPEIVTRYMEGRFGYCPPVKCYHHHDAHAASAFYASGMHESLIITFDHSGDGVSTQISVGKKGNLEMLKRFDRPNSLGIFYTMVTQYCGFKRDSDEYKLMGLSSYGNRNAMDWNWLLSANEGNYHLNEEYIIGIKPGEPSPSKQEPLFNTQFVEKMGRPARNTDADMNAFYKDVAASAQRHYESILCGLVQYYVAKTGIRNVCLAGGGALNCVANQNIMNLPEVDRLYIQPAAGDSGISLGAVYLASVENGNIPNPMNSIYLGSRYTDGEVEKALNTAKCRHQKIGNPAEKAAELVAEGKVIGWFQGAAEFGPRALGNRSILANPCIEGMDKVVNEKVKFRETFRPFCPSVLEEDASLFFEGKQATAPYMTITYNVKPEMQAAIPAVTHVDGTARIQTVNREQNALFYDYLVALKKKIGVGMTINTSFNRKDEPIVNSPVDAIATFYSCGLDALIIGPYLLEK